ncbi:hydroxylamine reductase [Dehalogenimonas etheniformans]|uniref:Hydroxylamine reductase n=1 Tax=Dehalogenimonas etheniformans TaxID=1536648 RepID=A0A2P5P863_9CHLR|nr:hydroxylamine reductase [Dehalogenimonas etheniformans]PPD58476.1 hydroxylamine reductase [Dehalogenimonas etheniformans]QNT76759.1 hydroxylamine reductase [Dehalogenimonas etheniformans]
MFCFQCEQTVGSKACTKVGACGKSPQVSAAQDELTAALVDLARTVEGKNTDSSMDGLMMRGLFVTVTNVNFDNQDFKELVEEVRSQTSRLGGSATFPAAALWRGDPDIVSLRSTLLFGLRGMAAYAWHARALGHTDETVTGWLYKGLREIECEHSVTEWFDLLMEFGRVNLKCMELLNAANTGTFGHPAPAQVTTTIEPGPFVVMSGHDLLDLEELLEQTAGKGVNVYTHGEMLPAHAYPGLRKYPHLKGNFGTAWQNQQQEFAGAPGVFVFNTNCLMPPKASYADRVFTSAVVAYPGLKHLPESGGRTDYTPAIEKALELGGYKTRQEFTGINGGKTLTTGFGLEAVMGVAGAVIEAVKSGAVKHFLLVGGCDGAKPGRNYYTELVAKSPADTFILTLACGKYRFNDLDLGTVGGLPRLIDVGQCNDAYSAIRIALALADAFKCGVNELPLSLVLSWYEQKAVCILLTLLALGIRNIRLGPSLPAFISPNVLAVLVEQFGLKPIDTAEADLKAILG